MQNGSRDYFLNRVSEILIQTYVKLKTSETKGIFRVANKGKEDHFAC